MGSHTQMSYMKGRYEFLNQDKSPPRKSGEYATFLKEKERVLGPEGWVDSRLCQKQYGGLQSGKGANDTASDQASGSGESGGRGRGGDAAKVSVVDLRSKQTKMQKQHERQLKVIEDHMWQHKQEERELKRSEGDIIKSQRSLRKMLRDYENAITKKRLAEEKKLHQSMNKYAEVQQQHTHEKEEISQKRREQKICTDQSYQEQDRRVQINSSHLSLQYKTKMSELELKKIEVARLSKEFENKLRQKEEEQFRLKQELADLSITLNMEAQKGRKLQADHKSDGQKQSNRKAAEDRDMENGIENKLAKSDGDTKAAEMNRRRLSADQALTKSHLALKQREESRKKQDTQNLIRSNVQVQRQLNDAAFEADLDLKAKQSDQKVQEHDMRRRKQATHQQQAKKEVTEEQEVQLRQKAVRRSLDTQRKDHDEQMKHFQRSVSHSADAEYNLYNRIKNAEYQRQQQEQAVRKLRTKLNEVKRNNSVQLRLQMTEQERNERDLEQQLLREQAKLAQAHCRREESYVRLQKQREVLRQDRDLLQKHEKEHDRLVRIGEKSDGTT